MLIRYERLASPKDRFLRRDLSWEMLKGHYINLCILAPNYAYPLSPLDQETLVGTP